MNRIEKEKCIEMMIEGICSGKFAEEAFKKSTEEEKNKDFTSAKISELKGQNALGYAEGINQVLVSIGFKHPQMEELSKLI
ncbi:MAG: hypothetical protein RRY19_11425 [Clostridium sp.]